MIKRIISAAILIPLVIWLLFYAKLYVIKAVLIGVANLGFYEWSGFVGVSTKDKIFYFFILNIISVSFLFFENCFIECLFFVFAVHLIFSFSSLKEKRLFENFYLFGGILYVLLYLFAGKVVEFNKGRELLFVALVVVWAGDSFAMFGGKAFGKHKLAALISPNKTIEGAVCGILGGIFFGVVAGIYFDFNLLFLVFVSLIASVVAVLGDLSESVVKRFFNVKDSSHLIPGHGGILDRLDSFSFVVFFVYLVLRCRELLF
ncbi:phosphatidate cytidylyltransferase [Hippea jasoniae]|uniref:phosphatidate cytidylyltransferase n=1 Tax=Hippea jasoniae TaxID=944479 RepID=UPI00068DC297|nr:phosphatidate cytidylyltransferase [Hippea jasoniae]